MFKLGNLSLTPASAIKRLEENDPTLISCELKHNAVLQMKGLELMPKIAEALAKNTVCQELNLAGCNINDSLAVILASGIEKNTSLVTLNLEENKVGNEGATALAKALKANRTLMQLNLMKQAGTKLGDATLHAFDDMFTQNVTLLKIIWRLESRQSFRLTKMLTRNNDIDRRIKAGKDYADLLPSGVSAIPEHLVSYRSLCSNLVGTPRTSSRASAEEGSEGAPPPRAVLPLVSGSSDNSQRSWRSVSMDSDAASAKAESPGAVSGGVSGGADFKVAMPAAKVAAAAPVAAAAMGGDGLLSEKLQALEEEYERRHAELKAEIAQRKQALLDAVPLS